MIYASNGTNQGFFSAKTGKFVPITKKYFNKWKQKTVKWWYTFGCVENSLGIEYVHLSSTYEWKKALTPEQHFIESKEAYRQFLSENINNNTTTIFHFFGPPHLELDENSISRMIDILDGKHSVK